jgi:hypothetical protein
MTAFLIYRKKSNRYRMQRKNYVLDVTLFCVHTHHRSRLFYRDTLQIPFYTRQKILDNHFISKGFFFSDTRPGAEGPLWPSMARAIPQFGPVKNQNLDIQPSSRSLPASLHGCTTGTAASRRTRRPLPPCRLLVFTSTASVWPAAGYPDTAARLRLTESPPRRS